MRLFYRAKGDDLLATDGKEKSSSSSTFGSAFAKFKSMDDCGVNDPKTSGSKKSGHRNTIRYNYSNLVTFDFVLVN